MTHQGKSMHHRGDAYFFYTIFYRKTNLRNLNNGIIEITADASGISSDVYYSKNGISANARLLISSDNTKIASDYFLLTPTVPGAVDLGLSVWWATEDLCAEEPGMGGPLFQWSKLEPNTTEAFDIPTLADIQGTEYDAATYILGEGWSIPTDEQFQELTQNCTFDRSGRTIIATGPNNKKIMIIYGNAYYWTSNYRYLDRHELMVWSFTYSSSTSKTTYSNTYLQGKTLSELSLHTCRIRPICK